jgi:hypothetical protein
MKRHILVEDQERPLIWVEGYDPRYLDDYPAWSRTARGWLFAIIGVATAVFWIVVFLGLFIAITSVV